MRTKEHGWNRIANVVLNFVKTTTIISFSENYMPDPKCLPMYVTRLATEVNWETEKECFESFARETAKFYSNVPASNQNGKDWKWITEHVLFPALKDYFLPPKSFVENGALLEIAKLQTLYKVFERC